MGKIISKKLIKNIYDMLFGDMKSKSFDGFEYAEYAVHVSVFNLF